MRTFTKMKHTMVLMPSTVYVISLNLFRKKYFLRILVMSDFLFLNYMSCSASSFQNMILQAQSIHLNFLL